MQQKKKKLLIIIKNIDGGTGTFLFQILKLEKIFDIKVCALERRKYGSNNFYKHIFYFRKEYTKVNQYTFNPIHYMNIIKEAIWLRSILIKENSDVVLSIDTHCNIIASFVVYFFKIKTRLIITTHNNISFVANQKAFLIQGILKKAGNFLFNKVDFIVCNSQGVAGDFKRYFGISKKTIVIPYGLDKTYIKKQLKKPILKNYNNIFTDGYKHIISIGRFENQKDFKTLIYAFSLVRKSMKNVSLLLIGDGSQKKELYDLTAKLNINNDIYFLGWQQNVFPFLNKSDIFILSSNYEGFGYVILEAMSQGIPVISTDSPFGPSEIIGKNKYGLLVPVGDTQKIAQAITRILLNRKIYNTYKKKSLDRIKDYPENKMLNFYSGIFKTT